MSPGRRRLLAVLGSLLVLIPLGLYVNREFFGKRGEHRALFQPSSYPDRIVLTWAGDPAASQAVTWRTAVTTTKGVAQIAPAEPNADFLNTAVSLEARTESLVSDLNTANYHSVRFEKLKAATKYVYRVGDGTSWSEWFQFKTASHEPDPFTFIYLGDAQNDVRALWSRVLREAHADAPRAAFILHAGDLINKGSADGEWGEWHGAGAWLNAMIPQVPTPGNHEYVRRTSLSDSEDRMLTPHWRPQFTLPENGPKGLEETAYWFEHQGTLVVSLNSNERLEEQAEWLDTLLTERKSAWTILMFHHPVYSAEKSRDNAKLRGLWKPVLDKHRVDLVLTGHDHAYARSGFNVPENVPEGTTARSEAGTVYVVSVSGPKMYSVGREEWMKRAAEKTQLYQIVRIDGDTLRYEARTAVGDLYDAFLLKKRGEEPNELIEQVPDTPERL